MSAADPFLVERPPHVPEGVVVDFDMYAPPNVDQGFHEAWLALRQPGTPDLVWTPRNGGHWMAMRGALVNEVLSNHEHFSSRIIVVPKIIGEQHRLIPTTIDPPAHRPYRVLLNSSLSPKAIGGAEARIRSTAIELIEAVRTKGQCNFTTDYAEQFPVRIFMGIVDLPLQDAPQLKFWSDCMVRHGMPMSFADARAAFYDYVAPYIDQRLGGAGEDMLSRMINGQVDGRALTREESLALVVQVLIAGLDTVVNFLGFVMLYLARTPDQRAVLAADPSLIPAAVDELFRRFPIVTIGREVRADMVVAGMNVKAGEIIITPTPLSGTDERMNEEPLKVDFHRKSMEHTTFGNGHHKCPGAHLARTEIRVTLEEWLQRIPEFSVAPGTVLKFGGGIVGTVNGLPLVWDVAKTKVVAG